MPIDITNARLVPENRVTERFDATVQCLKASLDAGTFTLVECLNMTEPFGLFAREILTNMRSNRAHDSGVANYLQIIMDVGQVERHEHDRKGEPTIRMSPVVIREGDKFVNIRGREHREPNYVAVPVGVQTAPTQAAMLLLARHGVGYRDQLSTRTGSLYACVRELGYVWRGRRFLTAREHPWVVEQVAQEAAQATEATRAAESARQPRREPRPGASP